MNDTNDDRLDLTVAKCVIGERSVSVATYEKIIKDLIEEVERLREEIESNKFVDEMNDLADMLECVDTEGKIVTESGIRNAVKDKIDSLIQEVNRLRLDESNAQHYSREAEQWEDEANRVELLRQEQITSLTKELESLKSGYSGNILKELEAVKKERDELESRLDLAIERERYVADKWQELIAENLQQAKDWDELDDECSNLKAGYKKAIEEVRNLSEAKGKLEAENAQLKSLSTTHKSIELSSIIEAHVHNEAKRIEEITDLKQKLAEAEEKCCVHDWDYKTTALKVCRLCGVSQ